MCDSWVSYTLGTSGVNFGHLSYLHEGINSGLILPWEILSEISPTRPRLTLCLLLIGSVMSYHSVNLFRSMYGGFPKTYIWARRMAHCASNFFSNNRIWVVSLTSSKFDTKFNSLRSCLISWYWAKSDQDQDSTTFIRLAKAKVSGEHFQDFEIGDQPERNII